MRIFYLFIHLLILSFVAFTPTFGQNCSDGKVSIKVRIKPDTRPQDIYWELVTANGDTLKKGTSAGDSICVSKSLCVKFTIHDRANNGLCCNSGRGYYELLYNNSLVARNAKYTSQETSWMGCQTCTDTTKAQYRIYINPDEYPQETSWTLTDGLNGDTLAKGKTQDDTVCVDRTKCLKFHIRDTQGDGICCQFGLGSYYVWKDSVLVASGGDFNSSEITYVGCAAGSFCSSPIVASLDTFTSIFDDTWYRFVPDTTGRFEITTCNLANACSTKIWVYDYCSGLNYAEDNTATLAYSFEGCGQNAKLEVILNKSQTYYIRIGDRQDNCNPDPVRWSLAFKGAIVGCKDSLSCTYNPLATVNDSTMCRYNPDTLCPDQPDLTVIAPLLRTSMRLDSLENADACAIQEGCLKGYGKRYLVRFDTRIENIGNADYYLGAPPNNPNASNNQWLWDPCHGHWHYRGYAEYILFDKNSNRIPAGFKAGFCVMDLNCSIGGGIAKYNCSNQGVTAGCGDIYSSNLKCQWIDITEVDTGRYTLVARVNWDNSPDKLGRVEADLTNNWGQVCIKIAKNSSGRVSVTADPVCNFYIDCEGTVMGNSKRDCEGVCKGKVVHGNMNADSALTNGDLYAYRNGVKAGNISATKCKDLNGDNKVNIVDLYMLENCLDQAPADTVGSNYQCEFEPLVQSPAFAQFRIDTINLNKGYLDMAIRSAVDDVTAFQFKLSGMDVDSVRMLNMADSGTIWTNFTEAGMVFGTIHRNQILHGLDYKRFIRVFFDTTTSNQACIDSVVGVVNKKNETMWRSKGPCRPLGTVTYLSQGKIKAGMRLIPNPFRTQTRFVFPNDAQEPYKLVIQDTQGRTVLERSQIRQSEFVVEKGTMAPGLYLYKLSGTEIYQGKMMIE